jgi:hypothetical protein
MKKTAFQKIYDRRAMEIDAIDVEYGVLIRNHLLQAYRAAKLKDKKLAGVVWDSVHNSFLLIGQAKPAAGSQLHDMAGYTIVPGAGVPFDAKHQETSALVDLINEYNGWLFQKMLPRIADIPANP